MFLARLGNPVVSACLRSALVTRAISPSRRRRRRRWWPMKQAHKSEKQLQLGPEQAGRQTDRPTAFAGANRRRSHRWVEQRDKHPISSLARRLTDYDLTCESGEMYGEAGGVAKLENFISNMCTLYSAYFVALSARSTGQLKQ